MLYDLLTHSEANIEKLKMIKNMCDDEVYIIIWKCSSVCFKCLLGTSIVLFIMLNLDLYMCLC
jgi:hypothetical protein